jgi:hypothetical protein
VFTVVPDPRTSTQRAADAEIDRFMRDERDPIELLRQNIVALFGEWKDRRRGSSPGGVVVEDCPACGATSQ